MIGHIKSVADRVNELIAQGKLSSMGNNVFMAHNTIPAELIMNETRDAVASKHEEFSPRVALASRIKRVSDIRELAEKWRAAHPDERFGDPTEEAASTPEPVAIEQPPKDTTPDFYGDRTDLTPVQRRFVQLYKRYYGADTNTPEKLPLKRRQSYPANDETIMNDKSLGYATALIMQLVASGQMSIDEIPPEVATNLWVWLDSTAPLAMRSAFSMRYHRALDSSNPAYEQLMEFADKLPALAIERWKARIVPDPQKNKPLRLMPFVDTGNIKKDIAGIDARIKQANAKLKASLGKYQGANVKPPQEVQIEQQGLLEEIQDLNRIKDAKKQELEASKGTQAEAGGAGRNQTYKTISLTSKDGQAIQYINPLYKLYDLMKQVASTDVPKIVQNVKIDPEAIGKDDEKMDFLENMPAQDKMGAPEESLLQNVPEQYEETKPFYRLRDYAQMASEGRINELLASYADLKLGSKPPTYDPPARLEVGAINPFEDDGSTIATPQEAQAINAQLQQKATEDFQRKLQEYSTSLEMRVLSAKSGAAYSQSLIEPIKRHFIEGGKEAQPFTTEELQKQAASYIEQNQKHDPNTHLGKVKEYTALLEKYQAQIIEKINKGETITPTNLLVSELFGEDEKGEFTDEFGEFKVNDPKAIKKLFTLLQQAEIDHVLDDYFHSGTPMPEPVRVITSNENPNYRIIFKLLLGEANRMEADENSEDRVRTLSTGSLFDEYCLNVSIQNDQVIHLMKSRLESLGLSEEKVDDILSKIAGILNQVPGKGARPADLLKTKISDIETLLTTETPANTPDIFIVNFATLATNYVPRTIPFIEAPPSFSESPFPAEFLSRIFGQSVDVLKFESQSDEVKLKVINDYIAGAFPRYIAVPSAITRAAQNSAYYEQTKDLWTRLISARDAMEENMRPEEFNKFSADLDLWADYIMSFMTAEGYDPERKKQEDTLRTNLNESWLVSARQAIQMTLVQMNYMHIRRQIAKEMNPGFPEKAEELKSVSYIGQKVPDKLVGILGFDVIETEDQIDLVNKMIDKVNQIQLREYTQDIQAYGEYKQPSASKVISVLATQIARRIDPNKRPADIMVDIKLKDPKTKLPKKMEHVSPNVEEGTDKPIMTTLDYDPGAIRGTEYDSANRSNDVTMNLYDALAAMLMMPRDSRAATDLSEVMAALGTDIAQNVQLMSYTPKDMKESGQVRDFGLNPVPGAERTPLADYPSGEAVEMESGLLQASPPEAKAFGTIDEAAGRPSLQFKDKGTVGVEKSNWSKDAQIIFGDLAQLAVSLIGKLSPKEVTIYHKRINKAILGFQTQVRNNIVNIARDNALDMKQWTNERDDNHKRIPRDQASIDFGTKLLQSIKESKLKLRAEEDPYQRVLLQKDIDAGEEFVRVNGLLTDDPNADYYKALQDYYVAEEKASEIFTMMPKPWPQELPKDKEAILGLLRDDLRAYAAMGLITGAETQGLGIEAEAPEAEAPQPEAEDTTLPEEPTALPMENEPNATDVEEEVVARVKGFKIRRESKFRFRGV